MQGWESAIPPSTGLWGRMTASAQEFKSSMGNTAKLHLKRKAGGTA
jgi:hypothetical protein